MHKKRIVCIGAVNIDRKIQPTFALERYTSNPATSTTSLGGVARNVAENLSRLGQCVQMVSVVGDDAEGAYIQDQLKEVMDVSGITRLPSQATGMYTAILDETGEMYLALADMSIYEAFSPTILANQSLLKEANCIVADLNCTQETLKYVCDLAKQNEQELFLIAVSGPKMKRMPVDLTAVSGLFINLGETEAYFNEQTHGEKEKIEQLLRCWQSLGVQTVVLTNGSKEIVVANKTIEWFAVKELAQQQVVDVTGAGDSFSAAFIDAYLSGEPTARQVLAGMTNAYSTIQTTDTVRRDLTKAKLLEEMRVY